VPRIVSQRTPSQAVNRELATKRFVELLQDAWKQIPKRRKTKATMASKVRRLEEKKQHGIVKQQRSKKVSDDD
jgi:ribosome-associated protein